MGTYSGREHNLDNLKAAVLKADWADPDLNPKLAAFCRHYATILLPCLPRTPQHKGKCENNVHYVKSNALANHSFSVLAGQNQHLAHWEFVAAQQNLFHLGLASGPAVGIIGAERVGYEKAYQWPGHQRHPKPFPGGRDRDGLRPAGVGGARDPAGH